VLLAWILLSVVRSGSSANVPLDETATDTAAAETNTVSDQGTGIVNNMGAMRTAELEEWGNDKMVQVSGQLTHVLNWDGAVSPVVHQFDRHKSQ
jgi:hypothetical protein